MRQEADDDEFVADDDDDGERPAKKTSGGAKHTENGDTIICELSGKRKVTVNTYHGHVYVNIREVRA